MQELKIANIEPNHKVNNTITSSTHRIKVKKFKIDIGADPNVLPYNILVFDKFCVGI